MSSSQPADDHPIRATSVMTVDDQELFLAAARDVISATAGFELIAEASSGPEAVELFTRLEPDLVLMDVRMPGLDGLETTRRLRALRPDAAVVLISLEDVTDMAAVTERAGAVAFIRKPDLCPQTLKDVWAAHVESRLRSSTSH
jgi:two-component system, NarL family, invasion response regulator UvrY